MADDQLTKHQRAAQNAIQKIVDSDATPQEKKDNLWRIMVFAKSQRDQIELEDRK